MFQVSLGDRRDGAHAAGSDKREQSERMSGAEARFEEDEYEAGGDGASVVDADEQMEAVEASIMGTAKVLNDNETPKRLTMQLIRQSMSMTIRQSAKRLLLDDEDGDEEPEKPDDEAEEIDALMQKKALRLDWMSIGKMENLDVFTHIHELYLQHNVIEKIENLDDHTELTFLALGGNRIKKVENIKHLRNLKFLDLSNNCIQDFDVREFPPSLRFLRLAGNPFTRHMPAYMHLFFERLPNLIQVDQYRRAASHMVDAVVASKGESGASSVSPFTLSSRSPYIELEMEVEMDRLSLTTPDDTAPSPTGECALVFDFNDYEKQKNERLDKWKKQLKDLETRKAEMETDIPVITRATSVRALRARRKEAIAKAKEATQSAIADSIAHFHQMEIQHKEWQEQQQQAA